MKSGIEMSDKLTRESMFWAKSVYKTCVLYYYSSDTRVALGLDITFSSECDFMESFLSSQYRVIRVIMNSIHRGPRKYQLVFRDNSGSFEI